MQVFLVDAASVSGAIHSSKFVSVNHYPREFNIPQKKNKTKQNIAVNHRIPWQKKIAFSYSDPREKLNDLKPL